MSRPLHSVHLGANQAWHGLGETGGGAGEACLPSYRSERTGVLNRRVGVYSRLNRTQSWVANDVNRRLAKFLYIKSFPKTC